MPYTDIQELPTHISTSDLLSKLESLGQLVCLSGKWGGNEASQHYDVLSAAPIISIKQEGDNTVVDDHAPDNKQVFSTTTLTAPALSWLSAYFEDKSDEQVRTTGISLPQSLPLALGFIGYISYDYGKQLETLPNIAVDDIELPHVHGGIYLWNIINDNKNQRTFLAFRSDCSPLLKARINHVLNQDIGCTDHFSLTASFEADMNYDCYQRKFDQVQKHIQQGDCYQVNLTHRHQAPYQGKPSAAFAHLHKTIKTPYSAYIDADHYQILSFSPESFISVRGNQIETKPIKGTIRRGDSDADDLALIAQLKNSKKDKAENLMIVDLLRNDMNRSCLPGSVKVTKLFDLETYPNVHHLVSTITGTKTNTTSTFDVLSNAFPGGSITGAPKIKAMEIIETLEPNRRGIYCGSICTIGFGGDMDSSICIRTLLCKSNVIYSWGGGGIVADSVCSDEYQESLTKTKNLIDSLEAMGKTSK